MGGRPGRSSFCGKTAAASRCTRLRHVCVWTRHGDKYRARFSSDACVLPPLYLKMLGALFSFFPSENEKRAFVASPTLQAWRRWPRSQGCRSSLLPDRVRRHPYSKAPPTESQTGWTQQDAGEARTSEVKNRALPASVWRFPTRKEGSPHRVGGKGGTMGRRGEGVQSLVSHFEG